MFDHPLVLARDNYGVIKSQFFEVSLNVEEQVAASIAVSGTFNGGQVDFLGTTDAQNWVAIKDILNGSSATNATAAGTFVFNIGGLKAIKAVGHTGLSGANITVAIHAVGGTSALFIGQQIIGGNPNSILSVDANGNLTEGVLIQDDGWTNANETWAYASATTITVPTGAASKYQVGDKIKITQTTVKYFIITGVADTVLTVTGGTDYSVANATITNNFYSKSENPQGFPAAFNYTPTITASTGTFTTVSAAGRFSVKARICYTSVEVDVTTHGTAAVETRATLPINAAFNVSGEFEKYVGSGIERFNTGDALVCKPISATVISIRNYQNGFDGADGSIQVVSIAYEI